MLQKYDNYQQYILLYVTHSFIHVTITANSGMKLISGILSFSTMVNKKLPYHLWLLFLFSTFDLETATLATMTELSTITETWEMLNLKDLQRRNTPR